MATNYQGFQFNSPPPNQPQPQQGMFQSQQFFPQPQGNIYLINNFLEMANVPTGVGISAALCLSEGVMYLKTMQNGQPNLDRIMEGADDYQYGRDRYRDSGSQDRMEEGLEKLMYALCVFIESMADFAETPEEKEIIRRHIQKMKNL